jgi:hypothetical protein
MDLESKINRAPFAPASAGEKVPKADEGAEKRKAGDERHQIVRDITSFAGLWSAIVFLVYSKRRSQT